MKCTCSKALLVEAVANVSRAVSPKSTLPVLEGILIRARDQHLEMTGYDLELGITTSIEAAIQEEGEMVLSAKLLSDMIRRMPGEDVSISCDEKMLTEIRSGSAQYTILGMPAEDFPELPALSDSESITISQGLLKSMIDQTLFAVATGDSKPVHTGSMFDVEEDQISLVSVDGYRLALRTEHIRTQQNTRFIVPGKTLAEISKLLGEDDTPTELQVSRKHILVNVEGYQVISRLLEGEFLDYRTAIPRDHSTEIRIETRSFMSAIERASLLISDRLKSPLRVRFDKELIQISCSTALGKAYDEIPCTTEGSEVEMGFNNKYILDALKAAGCDEVRLQMNGPLSPMKVVPAEGDGFLFLVLPVRLKS